MSGQLRRPNSQAALLRKLDKAVDYACAAITRLLKSGEKEKTFYLYNSRTFPITSKINRLLSDLQTSDGSHVAPA